MNALVLVDRVWVKFSGDRGGDGPMTLAQRNTFQWMGELGADRFLSMDEWMFQVPDGASVEDVAGAWGMLVSRHESLRTTYPGVCGAEGWPVQRVAVSGEIGVGVYRTTDQDPAQATVVRELTGLLREQGFEMDSELPVRVGVAVAPDGGVLAVVAVYSHMAVDFASMAVLGRQFNELVVGRDAQPAGPRALQPLDQAAVERSPRGQQRAEAALRYWHDQLRHRPQSLYAMPEATPAEPGGDGRPLACWLYSPAAAMALPHITDRTGASPAMVVLAAVSTILSHRSGTRPCFLTSPSSNRLGAQLRDYVGTLAQDSLLVIDTDTASFDEQVRRAGTASLRAQRHSAFDAIKLQAVHDELCHQRGIALTRDCSIDNLVGLRLDEIHATGEPPAEVPVGSPAEAAAALAQTVSGWWQPPDMTESLRLHLVNLGAALRFTLWAADTRRVPRSEFELVLRGVERLLVAAAAGDADLGRLSEITGVEPVVRDEGWVRVDSCWVELAACQRLAEEALPGSGVRVFAVPGPDGDPALTAYLTPEGRAGSPADAHQACMRLLPGRPTGMAPGWYVLCASAPGDPQDLDAWQRQPVLANGNGRPDTGGHENTGR
jgi:condensation domain-containing protein